MNSNKGNALISTLNLSDLPLLNALNPTGSHGTTDQTESTPSVWPRNPPECLCASTRRKQRTEDGQTQLDPKRASHEALPTFKFLAPSFIYEFYKTSVTYITAPNCPTDSIRNSNGAPNIWCIYSICIVDTVCQSMDDRSDRWMWLDGLTFPK